MSAQPQREKLTKRRVDAAKAQGVRYDLWDGALPGFALRVAPDGTKSFILRYRLRGQGRRSPKRFMSLGRNGAVTVDQARAAAQSILGEVAKGLDPAIAQRKAETTARNTLTAVCEEYLKRDGKALRTVEQRRALLKRLVFPALGARPIDQIKRGDIVALLDRIEDQSGPRMADMTLAVLRKIMNWHETRNEDFRSPIVRGMARTKPKERARQNTLNDDQLCAIWKAASEAEGPFSALIKFLLLTAARRTEAAAMTRAEINGGDWELPAARNKTKLDLIRPLSAAAQDVLASLPRIGNRYVFTTDGRSPLSGFSKAKRELEKRCGVTGWRLHDLRRTARTLMSRAGVNSDHAERALGHVINGVRATYDRHEFYQEKKAAFEALATQIADILKSKRAGR
jgi:integrase